MGERMDVIELTRQLVRIDSTNPGQYEKGMETFLLDYAKKLDCPQLEIQREMVSDGRNNVMLTLPGRPEYPEFVFICHMDTVPVGEGWQQDAFSGKLEDGKIWGRGSCDMKGGFACALSAFASAAAHVGQGQIPKRTLKLIGTVDEEGEMTGVEQVIRSGWVTKDSLVLDTEPTNGEIQVAHKGRTWFEISVEGITAHASTPWKGADAIAAMAEVISAIRTDFGQLEAHPQLGRSTVSFGRIRGGSQPYVVSGDCVVTVDMRLVPPYTSAFAEDIVKKAARRAKTEIPGANVSWKMTGDRPFIEKDEQSFLLAQLRKACETVTKTPAKTGFFNGYTDTAVIAGTLDNHNCMSYGPGDLERAHKPEEYVPVEDVLRCEKVLTELVQQLLY
jgi:succinyl-diaminopimelate desuccinylase